ncbi:hypothetical protein PGT21_032276 [Puccinia graminis f. sp. tritici]|uniref:Uncharacterized protein n=1 Tax=Puccinia graminis f. sp. tritici TaxID=56615 RepID=A0A5B0QY00_PUCGR|nr:hypothetical protein PGT21_032276 [Puccinia graminis f. sp. tritici]
MDKKHFIAGAQLAGAPPAKGAMLSQSGRRTFKKGGAVNPRYGPWNKSTAQENLVVVERVLQ